MPIEIGDYIEDTDPAISGQDRPVYGYVYKVGQHRIDFNVDLANSSPSWRGVKETLGELKLATKPSYAKPADNHASQQASEYYEAITS